MLAKLVSQRPSTWVEFLLPAIPIIGAYLLLPYFPNRQAWVAVPSMLLGAGLVIRQWRAAAMRTRALGLPRAYYDEVRKANLILLVSLFAGAALLIFANWHLFMVPVPA
jgi:hypothetical protein